MASSTQNSAELPTEKVKPTDKSEGKQPAADDSIVQAAINAWDPSKLDNVSFLPPANAKLDSPSLTGGFIEFTKDPFGDIWKTVDPIFGNKNTTEKDSLFTSLEEKIKPVLQLDTAFDWLLGPSEKSSPSDITLKTRDGQKLTDTQSSIEVIDRTGTVFHKDKVTGTITEIGAQGTKFERQKDGTMTLTEGDRKFVLTPDNKLTETTGGRTIEITDKETISTFRATSMRVFQHNCRNVPESEQNQQGIHTLENGVIRINATDGTKITVYPDGRKVIEGKDGNQYLVAKGEQSIVMVTQDGKKYLIDKDHNRALVQFNPDGTITIDNQKISVSGQVTTSDNVQVAANTNDTTIKNANGDGRDVVVQNNQSGVSTVTDGTGLSTKVDENTGKVTQINPDGKVDCFDTVHHIYNIQTADGNVSLSNDLTTLWNGDAIDRAGDIFLSSGAFIGADNAVRLSDGSGYDSYGRSLTARETQASLAASLSSAAQNIAAGIIYRAQSGMPTAGDIGLLGALYSQLGDVAGRCTAAGELGAAATALYAQSDCSSGINTTLATLHIQAQAENKLGSMTPGQVKQIQSVTTGSPSDQLLYQIKQSA